MQHIKQHLTLSFHIREFECYNVMRRMAPLFTRQYQLRLFDNFINPYRETPSLCADV